MIEFYCPSCGDWSEVQFSLLMAGEERMKCVNCDTTWRIVIQFYEVEEVAVITVGKAPHYPFDGAQDKNLKNVRCNWRSA